MVRVCQEINNWAKTISQKKWIFKSDRFIKKAMSLLAICQFIKQHPVYDETKHTLNMCPTSSNSL